MFVLLLIGAIVGLLGMVVCMTAIAVEARRVPNRPLHMRLNPFNILADQSLWTPEIRKLNRTGVWFGLVSLACVLLATLGSLIRGAP